MSYAEKSGNVTRMTSKLGQRIVIFDGDVFTFDCQHAAFLEATQQTADGFYRQAQIVTDIATSHRQAEFTRGEAALGKTTGQVVDECSQTFLGIFLRQQQDHVPDRL